MALSISRLATRLGTVVVQPIRPLGRLLLWLWTRVREFVAVIWPARFSAFTLAAGGALLVMTDQGQELAVTMAQHDRSVAERPWTQYLPSAAFYIFLACVGWYALQAWYWARISYTLKFGTGHREMDRRTAILPRVYAGLAFGFAAVAFWLADERLYAGYTLAAGAVLVLFLIYRVPLAERARRRRGTMRHATAPSRPEAGEGAAGKLQPATLMFLFVSCAFAAVTLAAVTVWPVQIGRWLGPAAVAFLAFGHIVPVGTLLVCLSWKTRIPMIASLLIWAVVISDVADNHAVPVIEETGAAEIQRPDVTEAARFWADATASGTGEGSARPVVFISAAGGGLRAAYWTAVVLGTLQRECPGFDRHLFSISGVSGGSVGAAIYQTALYNGLAADSAALCGAPSPRDEAVLSSVKQALRGDFLGPTLAAMLYPDLVQRFLPLGWPDRGAALVGAWNRSWMAALAAACEKTGCPATRGNLDDAFLKIAGRPGLSDRWRPVLALNGTHQETGKRIIASNVEVTTDDFLDAFDLLDLIGADVSMGTAALNSARFTYVSPAGLLVTKNGGIMRGHVLDGGYFENYGAITTAEIARTAIESFERQRVPVRPIVIQISSDPDLGWTDAPEQVGVRKFLSFVGSDRGCWYWLGQRALHFLGARSLELPTERTNCLANEMAGPVRGVLNTRTARGVLANKTVADVIDALQDAPYRFPTVVEPVFVHFRMCADAHGRKAPLGWAMSAATYDFLGERLMTTRCGEHSNEAALRTVLDALRHPVPVTCAGDDPDDPLVCRGRGGAAAR